MSQIMGSSKLKDGPMIHDKFEEKEYLSKMSMFNARIMFRIRSKTNEAQMNKQSDKNNAKNLWKCQECGNINTQSHIIWCPYFSSLREGKSLDNDEDLDSYSRKVFKTREDLLNRDE